MYSGVIGEGSPLLVRYQPIVTCAFSLNRSSPSPGREGIYLFIQKFQAHLSFLINWSYRIGGEQLVNRKRLTSRLSEGRKRLFSIAALILKGKTNRDSGTWSSVPFSHLVLYRTKKFHYLSFHHPFFSTTSLTIESPSLLIYFEGLLSFYTKRVTDWLPN